MNLNSLIDIDIDKSIKSARSIKRLSFNNESFKQITNLKVQERTQKEQAENSIDLKVYNSLREDIENEKSFVSDNQESFDCPYLLTTGENDFKPEDNTSNINKNSNVIMYEKIEMDVDFEKKKGDNLCESFFISGISPNKPSLIPNSGEFCSSCQHLSCNFLHAYEPEILYSFSQKQVKNFELNESVSESN